MSTLKAARRPAVAALMASLAMAMPARGGVCSGSPSPRVTKLGASLQPPRLAEHDYLGGAVALSGRILVAGAHGDDEGGANAGAAYVWKRGDDGRWADPTKLEARGAHPQDGFGISVAIAGIWAVVGASQDDEKGNGAGAAYVFQHGEDGAWRQWTKLIAPDGAPFDQFGGAVAVRGDTVAVGARGHGAHGVDSGAVYVYALAGGAWHHRATLSAPDASAGQRFGSSLSLGPATLLVGAPGDDEGGTGAGAAHVFARDGDRWRPSAKLVAHDAMTGDAFGHAVALGSDVAVATAIRHDAAATDGGAIYVFARTSAGWAEAQKIVAFDALPNELFGWSVAVLDDTLVVGAPYDTRGGDKEGPFGAAYVFRTQDGQWVPTEKLLAHEPNPFDFFGWSVALGPQVLALGARLDDGGALEGGAVYAHDFPCDPPAPRP